MQWDGERLCNIICSLDTNLMAHYQKVKIIFRKRDYSILEGGYVTEGDVQPFASLCNS